MQNASPPPSATAATHAFLLAEVIAGAALAGLLAGLFFGTTHMIRRMEKELVGQANAIRVLDNTLERIRHRPATDVTTAEDILRSELLACPEVWEKRPRAVCQPTPEGLVLTIRWDKRRLGAQVRLAWKDNAEGRVEMQ